MDSNTHSTSHQLTVTVDLDSLLGRPGTLGGEAGWAGPLDPETCQRLACDAAVTRVRRLMERQRLRYDLLGEDEQFFDARLDLVPASLAKGLEFDHVVLLEPADIVAGEPDEVTGLRRLYVCLTRAVTSLVVVHAAELPTALVA